MTGERRMPRRGKNGTGIDLLNRKAALPMLTTPIDVLVGKVGLQVGDEAAEVNRVTEISWPLIGATRLIEGAQQSVIQTLVRDKNLLEVATVMRSVGQETGEIPGQGREADTTETKPGQVQGHGQRNIARLEQSRMNDSDAGRSTTPLPFPVDVQTVRLRPGRNRMWKVGVGDRSDGKNRMT